uniref:Uncharacterized protein n=1 Tax=Meloidogyne javanica TaxID=6303 RepID=A0A915M1A4_MELJA
MFELDDEKLAKHKREHPELALDADFILEDARLKLIQSHSYEAKRKMMQRRQSLAATSARKHKMLRRAASTESDQIQDSSYKAKIPSSISKVGPKAKSSFLKATKQIKALLKKAGRQGAVDVGGEGGHFEFDAIPSASTRRQ